MAEGSSTFDAAFPTELESPPLISPVLAPEITEMRAPKKWILRHRCFEDLEDAGCGVNS